MRVEKELKAFNGIRPLDAGIAHVDVFRLANELIRRQGRPLIALINANSLLVFLRCAFCVFART